MLRLWLSFAKVGIISLVVIGCSQNISWVVLTEEEVKIVLLFSLFCYLICSSGVEFIEVTRGAQRWCCDPLSLVLRVGGVGGKGRVKANTEAQRPRSMM